MPAKISSPRNFVTHRVVPILAVSGAAAALLAATACANSTKQSATPTTATATSVASATATAQGLIPIPSGYPSAKAQSPRNENATVQAARQNPAPKGTPSPLPTTNSPTRTAGIQNNFHQSPIGQSFTVLNFWQGPINSDTWALVYAGGKTANNTGGVWLSTETGDPGSSNFSTQNIGFIKAPATAADVKLIAWPSATVVELETASNSGALTGTTMDFNVVTHQYSNVKSF